ncbi:DUF3102 domain-containing protein [Sporolactobacillus sp. STSJ-5]|uniref:DUF3102 domain-containing protein n=1 Tax=Sporolactobacillus sp. STSJ-5 TaxID=2965076 RepID=UPI0021081BED|nr:DUF3102 domain-containing protein [Sporolactobacillus sp. STSJ-5]MCQ2009239.1 DUF3102 domain-containing protein [Sporolactobacillus sp. STSJ-5]
MGMNDVATRTPVMIAAEINSIKEQTRKLLIVNSIEIGRRLSEAKSLLPHGEWGKWLEESVDYSQRTANNLMKVFQQYGDDQLGLFGTSLNSQTFANLSYSQAVALLSVPSDERENFVEENHVEEMSARELQKAIKEKENLQKQLDAERAKTQEKEKQYQNKAEALKKQLEVSERLHDELEAARKSGNEEEVNKLRETIDQSNKQAKKFEAQVNLLQQQLKEKPIDVPPAPEVVEKIPDEVVAEMAELRRADTQGRKETIEFKLRFDQLVSGFSDLLLSLADIPDPELKKKYGQAVHGLIMKMDERVK